MSIRIKPIEKGEKYEVNGKLVYLDSNGNWIASQELSTNEGKAFNNYRNAVIENNELKSHPEAEYTY
ncbi:MAG: hypothetical protein AB7D46_00690 [Flavobacteriaceae bacterium]